MSTADPTNDYSEDFSDDDAPYSRGSVIPEDVPPWEEEEPSEPHGGAGESAPAEDDRKSKYADLMEKYGDKSAASIYTVVIEEFVRNPPFDVQNQHEISIQDYLMNEIFNLISAHNAGLSKDDQAHRLWPPKSLPPKLIARVMAMRHRMVRLNLSGFGIGSKKQRESFAPLAFYDEETGLYVTDDEELRGMAWAFSPSMSAQAVIAALENLRQMSPVVDPCTDRDIVAVQNGLFNYRTKELTDFTPDVVIQSKTSVPWQGKAEKPVITMPDGKEWDPDSWMESLADSPEQMMLFWQFFGAMLRPRVSWNKVPIMYSDSGNNGKGTLLEALNHLAGDSACSLSLDDFNSEFELESMIGASAILSDESNFGGYLDNLSAFKATVTGDSVRIRRKHEKTVNLKPNVFMLQCMNSKPKVKDISGSFRRRLLLVPMSKTFTGRERKEIKDDYLQRSEVLEYIQWRVLAAEEDGGIPEFYEFIEPASSRESMEDFAEEGNPILTFWRWLGEEGNLHFYSVGAAYELYRAWLSRTQPGSMPVKQKTFTERSRIVLDQEPLMFQHMGDTKTTWGYTDPKYGSSFLIEEPLFVEFGLWSYLSCRGTSSARLDSELRKRSERGFRLKPLTSVTPLDAEPEADPWDTSPIAYEGA